MSLVRKDADSWCLRGRRRGSVATKEAMSYTFSHSGSDQKGGRTTWFMLMDGGGGLVS